MFLLSFLFWSSLSFSEPVVVSISQLSKGQKWTWSYSEWNQTEESWDAPYLYEVYSVVEQVKGRVTVEMASVSELSEPLDPHHKFTADVDDCLKKGLKSSSFRRYRIAFYTKSFGNGWQLVSKKHKALAFTEKFNCFSGASDFQTGSFDIKGATHPVFQWTQLPLDSWYSLDGSSELGGVMLRRRTRDIKVELVL